MVTSFHPVRQGVNPQSPDRQHPSLGSIPPPCGRPNRLKTRRPRRVRQGRIQRPLAPSFGGETRRLMASLLDRSSPTAQPCSRSRTCRRRSRARAARARAAAATVNNGPAHPFSAHCPLSLGAQPSRLETSNVCRDRVTGVTGVEFKNIACFKIHSNQNVCRVF